VNTSQNQPKSPKETQESGTDWEYEMKFTYQVKVDVSVHESVHEVAHSGKTHNPDFS
jgi:hypothetical protein